MEQCTAVQFNYSHFVADYYMQRKMFVLYLVGCCTLADRVRKVLLVSDKLSTYFGVGGSARSLHALKPPSIMLHSKIRRKYLFDNIFQVYFYFSKGYLAV